MRRYIWNNIVLELKIPIENKNVLWQQSFQVMNEEKRNFFSQKDHRFRDLIVGMKDFFGFFLNIFWIFFEFFWTFFQTFFRILQKCVYKLFLIDDIVVNWMREMVIFFVWILGKFREEWGWDFMDEFWLVIMVKKEMRKVDIITLLFISKLDMKFCVNNVRCYLLNLQ